MGLERPALFPGPGGCRRRGRDVLQNGLPCPTGLSSRFLGQGTADARPQLVVDVQKTLRVARRLGQTDDIRNIPHHPVGEKDALHLAAAVWDTGALQQVHQRQGAVVVPVEHSGLGLAVLRHLAEIAVLLLPVIDRNLPELRPAPTGGPHVLGVAVFVLLDKPVRRRHNLLCGAVILLHIQHLGVGIDPVKLGESLGIGRTEAVDTLVLVSHHEQIPALASQQADDGVLDFRGVLGLIHAVIPVPVPNRPQNLRILPENLEGIDHLVVVIHQLSVPQGLAVGLIEGREVQALHLNFRQLLPLEHLVLHIGDGGLEALYGALRGKLIGLVPVEFPQQSALLAAVLQQAEGGAAHDPLIIADYPAAHAVDGAEAQPLCRLLAEAGGKPPLHIPGGRHGIGHGEDALRLDAPHVAHVAQPGHQDGGFAAARHCQQQHRPLRLLHRSLLLRVQTDGKLCFELGKVHCLLQYPAHSAS